VHLQESPVDKPAADDDIQPASGAPFDLGALDEVEDLQEEAGHQPSTGLRWLVGSGIVALVGLGGWWGYQRFLKALPEPISVTLAPVQRDDLEMIITEAGVVELGGQQTFKAPGDVTVQAVLVEERQRVAQGQVLLELRDRSLQQDLEDRLVQSRINQLDLQRRQEQLAEQQSRLADAQARLIDSADLLERGFISEDEYRRDRLEFENAQSQVRDAEVEITKAELKVQQDDITVNNLRLQLADNQITSPMDAIVLKVDVQPGDGVQREGRLLSIGDPQQEIIRLQLTALNAAKVGIGMPVRVSVIGPNPEQFEGQLVRVSPQAISNSDDSGQSTVEAEARLRQPSGSLIPGSAVSVDIVLEQRQAVLVVPVAAVQREGGKPYVWVQDAAGLAQQRPVTLGLETLEAIEIAAGLQIGDEIVVDLPSEVQLSPGDPIDAIGSESDRPTAPRRGAP
jgi:HlyD family secretion protein